MYYAALCFMIVLLAFPLMGCQVDRYARDADREVQELIRQGHNEAIVGRESAVQYPQSASETPEEKASEREPTLSVDLSTALQIAVSGNRDYLSQRERLYSQGLSLSLTRFNFGPRLDATVSSLWSDAEESQGSTSLQTDFFLSQILPTGGTVRLGSSLGTTRVEGPHGDDPFNGRSYASGLSLDITQPLWRGAGYEVSHEALTQGERSFVYAIRDFELFRQDFSIDIARSYFDLVRESRELENARQRYDQAVFDLNKAEALHKVNRKKDQDVFLARRTELQLKDSLINAETAYERQVDRFKILLGLPISRDLVIVPQSPPFEVLDIDPESAVKVAIHNRLDLETARDRLEDFERFLRLSEDSLDPDVNLGLGFGLDGFDGEFHDADPEDWRATVRLDVVIPLQRRPERNAYRQSMIDLEQAKRDYALLLDDLELDIRNRIRSLLSLASQIDVQKQSIAQDERAVTVMQFRYEAGTVDNRDLIEAREGLVDARNALIGLQVDYFIARLVLLRNLGILFIDDQGMFKS